MTAPTIKPGTRCECRNPDCPGSLRERTDGPREACRDAAVRMVTVASPQDRGVPLASDPAEWWKRIPMCAPCAEYHEAKAGAR
jgi:hypothetical protein